MGVSHTLFSKMFCFLSEGFDPRERFGIRIVHCFEAEGRVTQLMGTMLGSAKPRSSSLGLSSRVCKCQREA